MIVLTIAVYLSLISVGGWILWGERKLIILGLRSYLWRRVDGVIIGSRDNSFLSSGINEYGTAVGPARFDETAHDYTYEVDGRYYRGSTYCFGSWADRMPATYGIGSKVSVYYDPGNPGLAVLKRGIKSGAIIGLVPLAAGAVGLVWVFLEN